MLRAVGRGDAIFNPGIARRLIRFLYHCAGGCAA